MSSPKSVPFLAALHALAFYVAAAIAAFGWACCALVRWDASPWMPLWFCGALLIYNVDRLRSDPADRINLPARTALIRRLRPAGFAIAALSALVLVVPPFLRRDWLSLALVVAGAIAGLSYSVPIFGARLKSVPLLKTFFAPVAVVCAIFVPPWLREGAPAHAFIALAWAWCLLEFNMILCDVRDIEGDGACGISTLPSLLGEKGTLSTLVALIVITTVLALAKGLVGPRDADSWLALGSVGAALLTTILIESRVRRSEQFYEWAVDGLLFFPAVIVTVVPLLSGRLT